MQPSGARQFQVFAQMTAAIIGGKPCPVQLRRFDRRATTSGLPPTSGKSLHRNN
jgi:hypothetical protein